MSGDLGEFFSLIGKAKKEKEDEFRSLVGDLDIDSMFSQVKVSIEEDKKKKKKEEKQIKALESWLFAETEEKTIEERPVIVGVDESNYDQWIEDEFSEREEEIVKEIVEETNIKEEVIIEAEDTVDHALKILETIKSKEEVRENLGDPEILKIRRELEYLKNLVNAQGGGGEVRLEFLDDVDRTTARVDGKFLQYQSSTGKWIGADASGGGGAGDYASVAGIATFATTAGVSTNSTKLNDQVASYYLDYNNFTNTPIIPTNNNQLTNGAGYITTSFTDTNQLTNGAGFITSSDSITGTASGLSGSPDIAITNITGIAASFTGNVTIGGTLIYEDVTNVDSIGYGTFRSGVEVQGAGSTTTTLNVTGVSTLANTIVGGATTELIVNGDARITGILTIGTGSITLDPNANKLSGIEEIILGIANTIRIKQDSNGEIEFTDFQGSQKSVGIGTTVSVNTSGIVTATSFSGTSFELNNGLISSAVSTTTTSSQTSVDSFSASTYRSAKYNVQITRGSEYQSTEISIVHDGSSSYGTEYATLKTGSSLATFSTDISGGNVRLLATPSSDTSTVFKLVRTLIEV